MKWEYLILHHTGAEEKDAEQIRRYHKSLGWQDTGYHFIIERDGQLVQGRSLSLNGAHCLADNMNTRGIGIALIGNMEKHPPLPEQLNTLVNFCSRLARQYRIPVENILGHREVPGAQTLCPGSCFSVEEVRAALYAANGPTLPGSEPAPTYWRVQLGAFSSEQPARAYAQKLKSIGLEAFVVRYNS